MIIPLFLVAGAVIIMAVLMKKSAQQASPAGTPSAASSAATGSESEVISWHVSSHDVVAITDIDGDAVEDFVGLYRVHNGKNIMVYLSGFTGTGKTAVAKWTRRLGDAMAEGAPTLADLVGSRLIIAHADQKSAWHLYSIDASSGEEQWKVAIPNSEGSIGGPTAFFTSATRIYLPHPYRLDIFATDSGKHVGNIGTD